MQEQRDTNALLQQLAGRPPETRPPPITVTAQPPPPSSPPPAPVTEAEVSPEREAARRGVEDLLHRILNALGLPSPAAPPPAPPPQQEESEDDSLGERVLKEKWKQLNRSPLAEPQPIRPSSVLNFEEWESYTESEEPAAPPPTIDIPAPPITVVEIPRSSSRPQARSDSPISTIEEQEDRRARRRRPSSLERDEREEQDEWEEGTSSSGPPRPPRQSRPEDRDPGLDFLNLVRDHRRARRGGDGTFISGDQPVRYCLSSWLVVSNENRSLFSLLFLDLRPLPLTWVRGDRSRRFQGTGTTSLPRSLSPALRSLPSLHPPQ